MKREDIEAEYLAFQESASSAARMAEAEIFQEFLDHEDGRRDAYLDSLEFDDVSGGPE